MGVHTYSEAALQASFNSVWLAKVRFYRTCAPTSILFVLGNFLHLISGLKHAFALVVKLCTSVVWIMFLFTPFSPQMGHPTICTHQLSPIIQQLKASTHFLWGT